MSLILDGTNGLTFNNASTQASAGVVLQVVSATIAQQVSTSSTSFVTANLTASITPKFSTSKILVILNTPWEQTTSGNGYATIYRNSTNLGNSNGMAQVGTNSIWTMLGINYLDSPATTSATSYTLYYRTSLGSLLYIGGDSVLSSITLMEIAA